MRRSASKYNCIVATAERRVKADAASEVQVMRGARQLELCVSQEM
jgi:hypothetical protein